MKRLTKKQEAAWAKKTLDAIVALGAVPDAHDDPESNYRSFVIETIHGPLRLFPYAEAIRSRFDTVPKGVTLIGAELNPHSGKWNFEFGLIPTDVELAMAISSIRRILPKKAAA